MSKPRSPKDLFAEGYRAALQDVIGFSVQYWPSEAKPSITKLVAQVKNCLYPARNIANSRKYKSGRLNAEASRG